MTPQIDPEENGDWAALVPELLVRNLDQSLAFYRDGCGFRLRHARPKMALPIWSLGARS
jgi:catechol 2,3-dioxygenase-like lactoylglutathione lyase family enzyme